MFHVDVQMFHLYIPTYAQASSGDRPSTGVEVINVDVPTVDIDAAKKVRNLCRSSTRFSCEICVTIDRELLS